MSMPRTTWESFQKKLDKSGGNEACWIWKGYVSRRYGVVSMNDHPVRSNRAAWMLAIGTIPPGKVVCHSCDVPLCCNPAHLFLGTINDNNQDKVLKGRQSFGEAVAHSILTRAQVHAIRTSLIAGETGRRLAERYGVSPATISAIKTGRIWDSRSSRNALGM